MTLSLNNFLEKYGEALEKALDMGELDKGIELVKKLFLLENMDQEARVACATMGTLMIGRKLRDVLLQGQEMQKIMALNIVEEQSVKDSLAAIANTETGNQEGN